MTPSRVELEDGREGGMVILLMGMAGAAFFDSYVVYNYSFFCLFLLIRNQISIALRRILRSILGFVGRLMCLCLCHVVSASVLFGYYVFFYHSGVTLAVPCAEVLPIDVATRMYHVD